MEAGGKSDLKIDYIERRSARVGLAKQTSIHVVPPDGPSVDLPVSIFDFSPGGLGMICEMRFDRGQEFTLRVEGAGTTAAELLYTVAYCKKTEEGTFRIGAEFICTTPQAHGSAHAKETQALLERIRQAVLNERPRAAG
jgi:hypothetical protein